MAADPAVRIRGLRKVFAAGGREVVALDGIDLDVAEGELVCLLGPSGCGKSTLRSTPWQSSPRPPPARWWPAGGRCAGPGRSLARSRAGRARTAESRSTRSATVSRRGVLVAVLSFQSCKPKNISEVTSGDAASKVYVAPGKYDEFYNFVSGGFNGQVGVYGLPSGRLLRIIPVFSAFPENGYGFSEETKPMLNTSHGFVPWDDLHHTELSQTNGEVDGRWLFGNGNNSPRIARIDLSTFRTRR